MKEGRTDAVWCAGRSEVNGAGTPRVGIIMGSDSDLATMRAAAEVRRAPAGTSGSSCGGRKVAVQPAGVICCL